LSCAVKELQGLDVSILIPIKGVIEVTDKGNERTFQMFPIGYIRRNEKDINLEVLKPFRPALKQLDRFSHVMVFWWAHKHDNEKSRSAL